MFCSGRSLQGDMVARQSALARTRDENVPRQTKGPEGLLKTPEALPDLDRLIHERIRLGIISALAANSSLSFNDLKRLLKTTDGNLSVHARRLEDEIGRASCRERV